MLRRAFIALLTLAGMARPAATYAQKAVDATGVQSMHHQQSLLLRAARIVDGQQRHENAAVVVSGGTIAALGAAVGEESLVP